MSTNLHSLEACNLADTAMVAAAAQEQLPTDQAKFVSEFTAQVTLIAEMSSVFI